MENQIKQDLLQARKDAMHGVESAAVKKDTLIMLMSSIRNAQIESKESLDDTQVIQIIKANIKQLNHSLEGANQGHRNDVIEKVTQQIAILQSYLPKQMTIDEVIAVLNAYDLPNDVVAGKLIGRVMREYTGQVDGQTVKAAVTQFLSTK